ncbi:MAG: hypothetical protein JXR48_19000 [Candidatus Delongbacteria bacterium]|nr:hypothetical protein [Candidatus Delongbacteria bacterium]MBN2837049.1 hypothetical protein [Candidatus Delongbacteria bacterium]
MSTIKKILVLLFLIVSYELFAQEEEPEYGKGSIFWFSASTNLAYKSFSIAVPVPLKNQFVSGRFTNYDELQLWSSEKLPDPESLNEKAFMYGLYSEQKYFQISFAIGIGFVDGEKDEDGEDALKDYDTMGFALEGQLFWRPLNFIGVGLMLTGNVNSENSYFTPTLGVQLALPN